MKQIRMIALDFDLTLVDYPPDGGYEVDPEALEAFAAIIRDGGRVGLVSGRDVWPMRDILAIAGSPWGEPFPNYCIRRENYLHYLEDGAWVEDIEWNHAVRERTTRFCMDHAAEIPDWLRLAEREGFSARHWILYADFGLEIHYPTEEMAAGAQRVLAEALKDRDGLVLHRNRMMLNAVPAGTGKGIALAHAAERFGLAPEQVLAFGDSDNDVSMLDGRHGFRSGTVLNSAADVQKCVLANGGYAAAERASHGVKQVLYRCAADGLIDALK